MIEVQIADGGWAMGETFGSAHGNVAGYFDRLKSQPSVVCVLGEAEPFFRMVPK